MKVAILGANDLARQIHHALREIGAEVLSFDPQKNPFHIQKRSLSRDEEIPGHCRFYDLFRVVYEQQYSPEFLQQFHSRRVGIPGLSEADTEHLLRPAQTFVDVDIVVDTLGLKKSVRRVPMLNESSPPFKNRISIGEPPDLRPLHHLAYIVCSPACLPLLEEFATWVVAEGKQLLLVARSFTPLQNDPRWLQLIAQRQLHFKQVQASFEQQMAEWESLADYERAKISRPAQPEPKIKLFKGYWPLGMDYLSDRKQAFLTLERPHFRGGDDLQTFAIDHVLFEQGLTVEKEPAFYCFEMQSCEVGHFVFVPQADGRGNTDQVNILLQKINGLFSKREM